MKIESDSSIPEGYKDVSVPIIDILQGAQSLALILLIVPLITHIILNGFNSFIDTTFNLKTLLLAIPMFIAFIIAHELIHAIGWVIFGRFSPKHIKFGFDRATLSPYAHAKVSMRANAYRIGAALPGIITGLIPILYGISIADGASTLLGAIMTSSAVGDIYVLWVIRNVPNQAIVRDHPSQAGCFVKIED